MPNGITYLLYNWNFKPPNPIHLFGILPISLCKITFHHFFCFVLFFNFYSGRKVCKDGNVPCLSKVKELSQVLKISQWPLFQVPWLIHDYFSSILGSRYFSSRYWAFFRRKPKGRKQERTRNLKEEKMQGEPVRNTHGFVSRWSYIHPPLGKRIGAGSMIFSTALAIPGTYSIYPRRKQRIWNFHRV